MLLIGLDVEMREREESKMTLGGWFENKVDEVEGGVVRVLLSKSRICKMFVTFRKSDK